jgi:hypothetical protein
MTFIARALPAGLESAALGDDMSPMAGSMALLQTRGATFGQALEETPAPPHDR